MKRTAAHQFTIKTVKISRIYVVSCFRVVVLSFILLLLPGCMNNADSRGASAPYGFESNFRQLQRNIDEQVRLSGLNHERSNDGKNENKSAEKKNLPFQNLAIPVPGGDEELHPDVHDNFEEDNVLSISFPSLMRIAIMMLFIVLII
jgi:hypothetical protein